MSLTLIRRQHVVPSGVADAPHPDPAAYVLDRLVKLLTHCDDATDGKPDSDLCIEVAMDAQGTASRVFEHFATPEALTLHLALETLAESLYRLAKDPANVTLRRSVLTRRNLVRDAACAWRNAGHTVDLNEEFARA